MKSKNQLAYPLYVVAAVAAAVITLSGCNHPSAAETQPSLPDTDPGIPLASNWLGAAQRYSTEELRVGFTDQAGTKGQLAQLLDRPALVTFFYTRCQNNYRCSATVSHMAKLQSELEAAGLGDSVRLLAITFEPQFDTPERIERYGRNRGLRFSSNVRALVLEAEGHAKLIDALETPVGFNSGWVNTHGVALDLFDAEAQFVRRYHTLVWKNDVVISDVRRLLEE